MPDLITADFARGLLEARGLDPALFPPERLAAAITAASESIQRWCGDRAFVRAVLDETLRVAWDGTVLLPQFPVIEVTWVGTTTDEAIFDFDLDERTGLLTLPGRGSGRVRVQYEAGFDPVPGPVQHACALVVADLIDPTNPRLASESAGAYAYTLDTALSGSHLTPIVQGLLAPYRSHHA